MYFKYFLKKIIIEFKLVTIKSI